MNARPVKHSLAALMLLLFAGCGADPPKPNLAEAEILVLDQKWVEAREMLKQYLVNHPDDAGAHFYLGRCYMLGEPLWPVVAEGEFQTALQLFNRNGKVSPLERYSSQVFEWFCYKEMATTLLLQIDHLVEGGVMPFQFAPLIEQARYYYERAVELQDDPEGLAEMDAILRGLEIESRKRPYRRPVPDPNA